MKKSFFKISLRLLKFVRPLVLKMLFSISAGITGHAAAIGMMSAAALFLCGAAGKTVPYGTRFWGYLMLILAALRGILHYLEQYKGHEIAFRLLAKIRAELFDSLRALSPAKLVDKKSADLVTSLMSDIEIIEVFFAHTIAPATIAAAMFLILSAFFTGFHPLLGLTASLAYLAEGIAVPYLGFTLSRKSGRTYRGTMSQLNSGLTDSLQGMKELILFGREKEAFEKIARDTVSLQKINSDIKKQEGFITGTSILIISIFSAAFLILACFLYKNQLLAETELFLTFITFVSSFAPFAALSSLSNTLTGTFAAAERIFDVTDEIPVIKNRAGAREMKGSEPSLECCGVSFGYNEKTILKDLSLFIKPGTKIAITGESGSGKTTLLRLFLRFWDVDKGAVKVKGEDVRNVTLESLRENTATLSQETYLFNTTIAENIALGWKNATQKEIEDAAKKAEIHDFIMTLPEGYNTLVGELGGRLSGGERQRIGIARTLLSNSDIVLLDEMTSSLDALNESAILKTIRETMKEKTVVTVTHRESVASKNDIIFHIKGGTK